MNYDEYLQEVQKDGLTLRDVPIDMITPEMCVEAIKNLQLEGEELEEFIEENIPEEVRTDIVYEEMVAKDADLIKLVPQKMLTDKILKIAGMTMEDLTKDSEEHEAEVTMEDLLNDLDEKEVHIDDSMASILPDEVEQIAEDDSMTGILPEDGEEISGEDIWQSIFDETKEIEQGKEKVETMEDLLGDIDEKGTPGDDDRDTMDSIAQEITRLEEIMNSVEEQRQQIASKKKELSIAKSVQLETERNGIDR